MIPTPPPAPLDARPARVNLRPVLSLLPILAYVGVRAIAGTQLAIGIALGALLASYVVGRNRGPLGGIAAFSLGLAIIGASVGMALNSDTAFLLREPAGDFAVALALLGSMILRRPIVGLVAREVAPRCVERLDLRGRLFIALTGLWVLQLLSAGAFRLYLLLQEIGPADYLLWSRVAAWSGGALAVAISVALVIGAARVARLRFDGLAAAPAFS